MAKAQQNVIVVGGGLAGLAAAMKLAELEVKVQLVSLVPVKRSHSVCAQGGINSVNELTRAQGDSEWKHFDDSVYGGDFLQHQPPVKEMCDWAPKVVDLLDRMGVPFNRTKEGYRDQRRFGGTLYKRTAFAGATTGQQLIYALDEQVRRWEAEGRVEKFEFYDFMGPILDGTGRCRGAVIRNLFDMKLKTLRGDAVILGTGGNGLIFGRSTMSTICTGNANARAFRAGVKYANGEFVQVHPTAIPGTDKLRLMSESARGEGGRVWVPRAPGDSRDPLAIPAGERYYFLEERYPKYGNLVPRDIATREIFNVCVNEGLSVENDRLCVYLDITEMPPAAQHKLEGILEIYEKFVGVDPRKTPMKIFPAVHYSMGGLWADYEKDPKTSGLAWGSIRNQHTNVPGIFAIGEADYQYHGANRLGANSLLSCVFAGLLSGPSVVNYLGQLGKSSAADQPQSLYDAALAREAAIDRTLLSSDGKENPYQIHKELGDVMTADCTVVRYNAKLKQTLVKIDELRDRFKRVGLSDRGDWTNQTLTFTRALDDMLLLGKVIAKGALQRDECRGAHYKPEHDIKAPTAESPADLRRQAEEWCRTFKQRNDRWLKSTIAVYDENDPPISYEEVDTSLIPPRPRTYGLKGAEIIEEVWREMSKQEPPLPSAIRSPVMAGSGTTAAG